MELKSFNHREHRGFTVNTEISSFISILCVKFGRPLRLISSILIVLLSGCAGSPDKNAPEAGRAAKINPDYSGVTIPPNIAPLNFSIEEPGSSFFARISSAPGHGIEIHSNNGNIQIPRIKWSELLDASKGKELKTEIYIKDEQGKWQKYNDLTNFISNDQVDPYLYYRILYPGYESWSELSINRRELSGFGTKPVLVNSVAEENCINCHSFNNGRTDDFMFHMRGSLGGTYISSGGGFSKINLKTAEMKNGAVYPRWHPSGKFIAFSANKIVQQFHAADNKKVEVTDLESSLVLYDVEKNEMMKINLAGSEKYMDTYPEWSPDGRYLYFCRARQVGQEFDYTTVRYDLYRVSFNTDDKTAGEPKLVFNASGINKSLSFPRVSPDGRFLVFTLADYGCFPIWHKEADLHLIDLESLQSSKLELSSDFTDSYHSWSSNSRWLVFSSKRTDGLTARPFISYIAENGKSGKPFILPQEDPDFYENFLKSYNVPEFSTVKIDPTPGEMRRLAKSKAIQAKWLNRLLTFRSKSEKE